ncbi:MAG: hypothetical protein F6J95_017035 [Leptolyngbya sp. SIO1E4]|nr:hypothetical protein [Leptolyngbya sp. SIO1E4]
MVCPSNSDTRQQLETLYRRSPSFPFHRRLLQFLQRMGAGIVYQLTRDLNEPRISKYYNVDGKALWYIYDPRTQTRFTAHSESDVREWLDRYHLL